MDMVGHQTPRQRVNSMPLHLIDEGVEVEQSVFGRVEYVLSIITALGDVVGNAGNDETRTPGHI
jgi:hypothetical protein